MTTEAIILSGGLGTRLRSVISDRPKTLALVAERPFLEYTLEHLQRHNVTRVVLAIGYLADLVRKTIGNKFGEIDILYSEESQPLGTGGAVASAMNQIQGDTFFLINGDTFCDVDFRVLDIFRQSTNAVVAMTLIQPNNPDRYGVVVIKNGRVTDFKSRSEWAVGPTLVNAGSYCLSREIKKYFPASENFSLEKDVFEVNYKEMLISGYHHTGYFIDIGVPEDYARAQIELPKLA